MGGERESEKKEGKREKKWGLSEHLEKLRSMGFITYVEKFPFILYSIERNNLNKAIEYCLALFNAFINPSGK